MLRTIGFYFGCLVWTFSLFGSHEELITELFKSELNVIPTKIETIELGLTNSNYKVQGGGRDYFTRIGSDHPEVLFISREKEVEFLAKAEELKLVPKILYSDASQGILIMPFIEGAESYGKVLEVWTGEREEVIDRIVGVMKDIHRTKAPIRYRDPYLFAIIDKYIDESHNYGADLPSDIDGALSLIEKVKNVLPEGEEVMCHHDFFWGNVLYDGKKLWLIDWEYADWGDPYEDLASFCVEHILDEEERELVLASYFSSYGKAEVEKLELMCMVYSLKVALWGYLQKMLCPEMSFDILPIANNHYANFWKYAGKIRAID